MSLAAEPLFLQLDSQLAGNTKKESDVEDNMDELTNDAFDVLSFTENAAGIGEAEGQKKIKTQGAKEAPKAKKKGKLKKENMMNEEEAIAAFSEQKLTDAAETLAQAEQQ